MPGALIIALLSVVSFVIVLAKTSILSIANSLIEAAMSGVGTMLDSTQSDDAKERAVRESGLKLIVGAWSVFWRFALALAAVALPIVLAHAAGLVRQEDSMGVLLRIDFIIIVSLIGVALSWALRRRSRTDVPPARISGSSSYGPAEKFMHELAFSSPAMIRRLSLVDDLLFARAIDSLPDNPPVFITSLARGGTTALLNALHELPQISTHRYRDMPFVSAPLSWSKIPGHGSNSQTRQRAHGDGMEIGPESPEAFDEIFWYLHWPEKYDEDVIDLWHSADAKSDATAFFRRHFRKIAKLRHSENVATADHAIRYLSKNNANIARLDLLPRMFPDCDIVVALRQPAAHAASLLRQHQNFSRMHAEDAFAMRYMRDIGHFEFGLLHKPLGFGSEFRSVYDPMQPDYWLAYWLAAFENVADRVEKVHIVTQDSLRDRPQATLETLLERLSLASGTTHDFTQYFRAGSDPQPDHLFDESLLKRALNIYRTLAASSVR